MFLIHPLNELLTHHLPLITQLIIPASEYLLKFMNPSFKCF